MNHYNIDYLRESMVKILSSDEKTVVGSGFIIRSDGYLITCHHVIYLLDSLNVEYQGRIYAADWCEEFSNPEADVAILKIEIKDAKAVPIINPQHLSTSVTVYGFPAAKKTNFPEGFAVFAQSIRRSSSLNTVSTYRAREIKSTNPWNKLPQDESMFLSHRIDAKVDSGTSGGAVFAEELGGVVGVIQCSKSDESYVIRWDNIRASLDKLGLEPHKSAVCKFLQNIEDNLKYISISLFHTKQPIILKEQYVPIQVTLKNKSKGNIGNESKDETGNKSKDETENIIKSTENEAEMKQIYAMKKVDKESPQTQLTWEEAKKQHQKIIVLADPGMGKSTLLRMEAASTAQQEKQKLLNQKTTIEDVVLPLVIKLSELDKRAEKIIEAISILTEEYYPETFPTLEYLLKEKLSNGKCLLLLDALDEVPKHRRIELTEKLNRFARTYRGQIIYTSRIVGYSSAFVESVAEVEIVPFSQKQTEDYIKIWFKNAVSYIEDDSISADELIQELHNKPQIGGLAQNPLLLSLLCSLYQEKGLTLPARRCQVYTKAVEYMLGKWGIDNRRQSPDEARLSAKKQLLEELAYQFTCEGKEIFSMDELISKTEKYLQSETVLSDFRNFSSSSLIGELSEQDGILQKLVREGYKYLFLHRTFQEYFTASYLKRAIEENQKGGIALAREHFWKYDWHETLSLLAGLLEKPYLLLQTITHEKDDIFKTLLLLAGQCLAECQENSHPLTIQIIEKIYKFWQSYPDADFINFTVVVLGKVNSQMSKRLRDALNHSDSQVREQAAEALLKIGNPQAMATLISVFYRSQDSQFQYVWRATESLVKIGNLQAVNTLSTALNYSDNYMRWQAAESLVKIGNLQAVEALSAALNHSDSLVRWRAAEALMKIGNPQAVEALSAALNHSDSSVRRQAAEALVKIGNPQGIKALSAARNDSDTYVRIQAAIASVMMGNPQAVDALIAALNHSDSSVRRQAAEALGKIGNPQAVDALSAALNHSDSSVRRQAVEALGKIGNPQAVDALSAALNHSDSYVRKQAIIALGKIGNPQVVDALMAAFNHSGSDVKKQATIALVMMGNPQAVQALVAALKDSDKSVRWQAALALGEIGNPQGVKALVAALNDSDSNVRRQAIEALAKINSPQVVYALSAALKYSDSSVRRQAAIALGKTGNPQAVNALITVLNDSDSNVRRQAVSALSEIGNPQAVNALISAVKDSDSNVRRQAAIALGKTDNSQGVEALISILINHSDSEIRERVAKALGKIDNSQVVKALNTALYDSDKYVRWQVAKALVEMDNTQAVNALIAALNHSDKKVRSQATEALGKIGNSQAMAALIAALNDSDSNVRSQAAIALGKIGNSQAVQALIAVLNDSDTDVRWQTAIALGKIGNSQAVQALVAALNDSDSDVRWQAAIALGKIDNPQGVKVLIAALNGSSTGTRWQAAIVLAKIGNPQGVKALIADLNHSDSSLRSQAVTVLGKIDSPEVLKKLIQRTDINIYHRDIFPLARTLAVRFSRARLPFIPVYPEKVRFP